MSRHQYMQQLEGVKKTVKLEPHRCDLCGELLYIPENSIHQLELDRKIDDVLQWELCYKCYDKFLDWILKQAGER